MPNAITNAVAAALLAALPLTISGAAMAQTDTEPATESDAAAGTEAGAEAGTDAGTQTGEAPAEPAPAEEPPTGPKRYKAPAPESATGVPALDEAIEAQRQAEQAEAEANPAEGTDAETGAEVVETAEEGTGPFVGDYTIGDPEAPVQVIEYASLTCPHCAAFHEEAWPGLKEEFVEPGQIGFTLRDVYFDRFGLWASMAARCGGERAFYPLVNQFLVHQEDWTRIENVAQAIAGIARRAGLTDAQLKACLENQDFAKLLVETYQENAKADEIQSTPSFLIVGPEGTERVVGNRPAEVRKAIEEALGAAG